VSESTKALELRGITFNQFGITFDSKVADGRRIHVPWSRIRQAMAVVDDREDLDPHPEDYADVPL
jgi:hypothetical protein